MDNVEVRIKRISKYHYRIIDNEGTSFGSIVNGIVEYLEFRNIYSAKAYIEKDSRLVLVD